MKSLVVTADDFGNDVAVNEAVEIAHRDGVLTAASLMVGAPAAADAIKRAKRLKTLGVGLHLVLVDGVPVLPPEVIPGLVDNEGHFRDNMVTAGAAMFFLPATRRQLALEIAAQFDAFAATGLALDHVNAHKHFHLHPTIAAIIARYSLRYNVRAIRAPIEPGRWSPTRPWARHIATSFRRRHVTVPDAVFGLRQSGAMTADRVRAAVAALPDGLSEIYLHPATRDDYPGHGPAYRHTAELAALLDPRVAEQIAAADIRLGPFAAMN